MKYRIIEAICFVALAAFIAFTITQSAGTDKTASQITKAMMSDGDFDGLTKRDSQRLKKNFSIEKADIEAFSYYSSDDVMNVDELLVIKLSSQQNADEIIADINSYVSSRLDIFEGYGEEQTARLRECLIKKQGNCIAFAVCGDTRKAEELFEKSIKD